MDEKKRIDIILTPEQLDQLAPLFDEVEKACPDPFAVACGARPDDRGVIWAQVYRRGFAKCVFLPGDYAQAVIDVMAEENKKRGWTRAVDPTKGGG